MEMIEKVAKAIYEADPEGGYDPEDPNTVWRSDAWRPEVWEGWVGIAKAAIQAMREPSMQMIQAGLNNQAYVDSTLHSTWRSMIDEASGERHRAVANTDAPGKSGMGEG